MPSDAEAVLEWGLNTPFNSQDKPPLVTMVATLNGVRSLGRYRLVVARGSKLRLTQEATAAVASHSRDHIVILPCLAALVLFLAFVNRIRRVASSGDKVQIRWHWRHFER